MPAIADQHGGGSEQGDRKDVGAATVAEGFLLPVDRPLLC